MFFKLKNQIKRIIYSKNHCTISNDVEIYNSSFSKYCNVAHHASITNCTLGSRTSVGRYSKLRDCSIGSYCSISWDVTIGAVSHPMDRITTHAFTYKKQFGITNKNMNLTQKLTIVGNDVWIGCGAIIIAGIKIGNGAIIGAGAVVTKDVEPYTIVAGVPATKIKNRFDDIDSNKLKNIDWWNYSDDCLKENVELFTCKLDDNVLNSISNLKGRV